MSFDKIINDITNHNNEIDKLNNDLHDYYYSLCNAIYDKMKELEPDLPNIEFLLKISKNRKDFNACVTFVDKSKTKLNYIIKIFNILKINNLDENNEFYKLNIQLIKDLEISENYKCEAILILTLLHELGHIYFIKTYIEKNRLLDKYRFYNTIDINQTNLLFYKEDMSIYDKHSLYRMKRTELFADNFAYRYFYTIWKHVKETYIK